MVDPKKKDNGSATYLRIGITVIPILLACIATYYSARMAVNSSIQSNSSQIEFVKSRLDRNVLGINDRVNELRIILNAHLASGPDGLRHPAALIVKINRLKERVKVLEEERKILEEEVRVLENRVTRNN